MSAVICVSIINWPSNQVRSRHSDDLVTTGAPIFLGGTRATQLPDYPVTIRVALDGLPGGCAFGVAPTRLIIFATVVPAHAPILPRRRDNTGWQQHSLCCHKASQYCAPMRLVIAECTVDYAGRLSAHLPKAMRLLMVKADGSVSIHSDGRAYKPLNWMSPPCSLAESTENDLTVWTVANKAGEQLVITLHEIHHDSDHSLGEDPGLQKDGVEAHLQELLAEHVQVFGHGWSLVRREYMTAIGPVDLLCRDDQGATVAVEIKRRGEIDGVEQLTRYLDLLNRDPHLAPVTGIFAAQEIKPQARTLAADRGIRCVVVDYDELRGLESSQVLLF